MFDSTFFIAFGSIALLALIVAVLLAYFVDYLIAGIALVLILLFGGIGTPLVRAISHAISSPNTVVVATPTPSAAVVNPTVQPGVANPTQVAGAEVPATYQIVTGDILGEPRMCRYVVSEPNGQLPSFKAKGVVSGVQYFTATSATYNEELNKVLATANHGGPCYALPPGAQLPN